MGINELFLWGTGAVLAIFVATVGVMLTLPHPRYKIAYWCAWASGLIFIFTAVVWGVITPETASIRIPAVLLAGFIGAAAAFLVTEAIRAASYREAQQAQAQVQIPAAPSAGVNAPMPDKPSQSPSAAVVLRGKFTDGDISFGDIITNGAPGIEVDSEEFARTKLSVKSITVKTPKRPFSMPILGSSVNKVSGTKNLDAIIHLEMPSDPPLKYIRFIANNAGILDVSIVSKRSGAGMEVTKGKDEHGRRFASLSNPSGQFDLILRAPPGTPANLIAVAEDR